MIPQSSSSKVSFVNRNLKMYHLWLIALVGNTEVIYMSGVLISKRFEISVWFFMVYATKVGTGGLKLRKNIPLRMLNIKTLYFLILFINMAAGTR